MDAERQVAWRVALVGQVLAVLLMVVLGIVAARGLAQFSASSAWVEQTYLVLDRMVALAEHANDIMARTRGYVFSGHGSYIEDLRTTQREANAELAELRALASVVEVEDTTHLMPQLTALQKPLAEAAAAADEVVQVATAQGQTAGLATLTRLGLAAQVDRIVEAIAAAMQGQRARVTTRHQEQRDAANRAVEAILAGGAVAVALALTSGGLLGRDRRRRRRAEAELVRVHAEFKDLYDHAPCGYHFLDDAMRIQRINETELAWLGHSREAVLGRPIADFLTATSRAKVQAGFAGYQATGKVSELELELVRKDGSTLPALVSATAVRDAQGRIVGSRTVLVDISELKRSSAERERLIAELQAALAEVKQLSSLLPMCAWCKKIRTDAGYYLEVEAYLAEHAAVQVTHSICPDCARKIASAGDEPTEGR